MTTRPTMPHTKQKVLVVDDHSVFREGLIQILNKEKELMVCGEAADAAEAMKQVSHSRPDLVIVDISLEGSNGIELTKNIKEQHPDIAILILSMHKETLYAERALRVGANGYIMKRESGRQLLAAIYHVLRGQVYVSRAVNESILRRMTSGGLPHDASPLESLSDRELEIFQLIGEGYGTRQISEKLDLSMKTVESHREHIREKLNLNSTFELVQQAIHWSRSEILPKHKRI